LGSALVGWAWHHARPVPFCYPFLPPRPIPARRLHERGIFVPTLWKDCLQREQAGFEWERELASNLLPLPLDHRLGEDDIEYVLGAVLQLLKG